MRDHEQEVLEWVNQTRKDYGIGEPLAELPPDASGGGLPSETCVIAQALGRGCGERAAWIGGVRVEFPQVVAEFLRAHDDRVNWAV